MGWLKKPGSYFLLFVFIAVLVTATSRLLGPKIGNTFSTISACLPDAVPCGATTTIPISGTVITEPTSGDSISPAEEQLEQIDQLLSQSIQSSIAYNVPETVTLD